MVVDAVMSLDELLSLKMIGIKKVQGGALEVCILYFFYHFKQNFPLKLLNTRYDGYRNKYMGQSWKI